MAEMKITGQRAKGQHPPVLMALQPKKRKKATCPWWSVGSRPDVAPGAAVETIGIDSLRQAFYLDVLARLASVSGGCGWRGRGLGMMRLRMLCAPCVAWTPVTRTVDGRSKTVRTERGRTRQGALACLWRAPAAERGGPERLARYQQGEDAPLLWVGSGRAAAGRQPGRLTACRDGKGCQREPAGDVRGASGDRAGLDRLAILFFGYFGSYKKKTCWFISGCGLPRQRLARRCPCLTFG